MGTEKTSFTRARVLVRHGSRPVERLDVAAQNRVTTLAQLEEPLALTDEERAGVLPRDKLALAITPHFFNLIERSIPDGPIRARSSRASRKAGPPQELSDPCGEDSHMPVPGLVHRYPDRVLFLVTDRCAGTAGTAPARASSVGWANRICTPSGQHSATWKSPEVRDVLLSGGDPLVFPVGGSIKSAHPAARHPAHPIRPHRLAASRFSCPSASLPSSARCWRSIIRC